MLSTEQKLVLLELLSNSFHLKDILALFQKTVLKQSQASGSILYLLDKKRPNSLTAKAIATPEALKEFAKIYLDSDIDLDYNHIFMNCLKSKSILEIPSSSDSDLSTQQNEHKISSLWKIHHGFVFPIIRSDSEESLPIGILLLYNDKISFTEAQKTTVQELIDLFYYDFVNAMTIDEVLQNKNAILSSKEKFKKIVSFVSQINILSDPSSLYETLIVEFAKNYGFDLGFIQLAMDNKLFPAAGATTMPQLKTKLSQLMAHFLKPENIPLLENPLLPESAACTVFFHKTHFFFPDAQKLLNLPMLEKDRKAIEVAPKPLRSVLLLPIISDNNSIGVLQLWSITHNIHLTETDFEVLYSLCSFIPSIIKNAKMYSNLKLTQYRLEETNQQLLKKNEEIENRHLQTQQELKLAHNVQFQLLPSRYPDIPGLRFTHLYQPMEEVGGDIYDFVKFKENHLVGLFVSDVSGHGMPAALITSMIKTLLETSGRRRLDPIDLLSYINDKIVHQIEGNYLTAFYGVYDTDTQRLLYSRAAHPFPFLIRDNKIIPLKGKGTVLGMLEAMEFHHYEIYLKPGDKLLVFTDGLPEAQNSQDERFGTKLAEITLKYAHLEIDNLIKAIYYHLCDFCERDTFEDDICIVGMELIKEAESVENIS